MDALASAASGAPAPPEPTSARRGPPSRAGRAMNRPTLLVVDDDEDLRTQMKWALADDYVVVLAGDRPEALERMRESRPAVVTLDLGLPPKAAGVAEGFAALTAIHEVDPGTKVIVVTGRDEREHALTAVA